jgi:hypothetical protein
VGLQLYKKWTFHELFCEKVKTDQALYRLLFHMEAVDENGAISADEWEAASMYPSSSFFFVLLSLATAPPPTI